MRSYYNINQAPNVIRNGYFHILFHNTANTNNLFSQLQKFNTQTDL